MLLGREKEGDGLYSREQMYHSITCSLEKSRRRRREECGVARERVDEWKDGWGWVEVWVEGWVGGMEDDRNS